MDLGEIMRILRRRWRIFVPGLLVTLLVAAGAWAKIPPKYQSQATVSMMNSKQGSAIQPFNGNAYLAFDSTLTDTADFLARDLSSAAAGQQLAQQGVTDSYTAALSSNAMGPFITLTVTGTDKAHVLKSEQTLVAFAGQELQRLQTEANAPVNSMIGVATVVPPEPPAKQSKSKIQLVAIAFLLCLILTLLTTFLTDTFSRRPKVAAGRQRGAARPIPAPVNGHGNPEDDWTVELTGSPFGSLEPEEFESPPSDSGLRQRPSVRHRDP